MKNSQIRQDLPLSINDRVILPFREGLKFRENKVLAKISEFTVYYPNLYMKICLRKEYFDLCPSENTMYPALSKQVS